MKFELSITFTVLPYTEVQMDISTTLDDNDISNKKKTRFQAVANALDSLGNIKDLIAVSPKWFLATDMDSTSSFGVYNTDSLLRDTLWGTIDSITGDFTPNPDYFGKVYFVSIYGGPNPSTTRFARDSAKD